VPLSNFVPRGFGFVRHSIAILYHQAPNPYITIRNFSIVVGGASWGSVSGMPTMLQRLAGMTMHTDYVEAFEEMMARHTVDPAEAREEATRCSPAPSTYGLPDDFRDHSFDLLAGGEPSPHRDLRLSPSLPRGLPAHNHLTGRERLGSPTLQTLREPNLADALALALFEVAAFQTLRLGWLGWGCTY
jgi:hypothetical protein